MNQAVPAKGSMGLSMGGPAADPSKLPLPQLRGDLIVYETNPDDTGQPRWHIFDNARNRYFLMGYVAYNLFLTWPSSRTLGGLVERTNRVIAQTVTIEDAQELLQFFQTSQLFVARSKRAVEGLEEVQEAGKTNPFKKILHGYLFFRVPFFRPDRFLNKTIKYVNFVFTPTFWLISSLIGLIGIYLTSKQLDVYFNTLLNFFSLEGLAVYGVFLGLAKVMHEAGHAYTAKHFGCEVPTIGAAFLVMWPVLYTDGTALWRLRSKRQRLLINCGGIIVECWLAAVCLFAWNVLPDGPLRAACFVMSTITLAGTLLINLNMFMRFDGYYIFADFLGIENLQNRAFALGKWKLRRWLFGIELAPPEAFSGYRHNLLIWYAFGIWVYRFFLFLGIAVLVYYLFFKLLGIILFIVEIVFFLGKPIAKELMVWWKARDQLSWNMQSIRTVVIIGALFFIALIPWQSRLSAVAFIEREKSAIIFSPQQGVLTELLVGKGDNVEEGQLLARISSPYLEASLEIEQIELEANNVRLRRAAASSVALEQLQVTAHERQQRLARINALNEEHAKLEVIAPLSARIVSLDDALRPGLWLAANHPMMQLVSDGKNRVIGYIKEEDLGRIEPGKEARFFPETSSFPSLPLIVTSIARSSVTSLRREELASTYGGEIAVRPDSQEQLVPLDAIYRVTFALADAENTHAKGEDFLSLRGRVFIDAERESPLLRLARLVIAAVIRESGM